MRIFIVFCQIVILFTLALANQPQSSNASLRSTAIGIGDAAPDFTLEDQNHTQITLSDARSHGPVVLVFYRGYW
jgi:cytochrome oxidase Cu insertion factor (SCO1/SenC/PrrC family)